MEASDNVGSDFRDGALGTLPDSVFNRETSPPDMRAYSEEDDDVTQFVEPAQLEVKWIVQITAFDRRILCTDQLVAELRRGQSVCHDTLAWCAGMEDWLPIASIAELRGAAREAATLPPRGNRQRAATRGGRQRAATLTSPPTTGRVVLAAGAIALVASALTTCGLDSLGVFEPGRGATDSAPGLERRQSTGALRPAEVPARRQSYSAPR